MNSLTLIILAFVMLFFILGVIAYALYILARDERRMMEKEEDI